jgi:nucleotide-binding universal stress UspA family protein
MSAELHIERVDNLVRDAAGGTDRCSEKGRMRAYQTVVVGTDGSESSLRAVDRAGEIAANSDAQVFISTGYMPPTDDLHAADILKDEGYKMHGRAPIYAILQDARDRAKAAGATNIEERPIQDAPVHALVDLAEQVGADLLVVGNVGLHARSAILERLFSVPGAVANRAKIDVLIVHTTD